MIGSFPPEAAMSSAAYWLLPPLLPLLVACLLVVRPWRPALVGLAPWAALPGLLVAVTATSEGGIELPGLLLGVHLGLHATTRVFLFFTSVLWLVAGLYAVAHHHADPGRPVFFIYYLLAMSGNVGLVLARDAVSFLALFALMSFASYGLVVHSGTPKARWAGKVYIILVVLGETLLFPALLMASGHADSLLLADIVERLPDAPHRNWIVGLLVLGFGIKAGALPLHVWLPLAHPAAPVPASAVLSGCMIKAGLLGWIVFLPLGTFAMPGWGTVFLVVGATAALFGLLAGLLQMDAKVLLAYSSIGKMGWMTAALGIALAAPKAWPDVRLAVCVYALFHALTKGTLFLSTGAAKLPARTASGYVGLWLGLLIPVLVFAGLAGTGGAAAKAALKGVSKYAPGLWSGALGHLLTWSGVLGALVMARFVYLVRPHRGETSASVPVKGCVVPWSGSILLAVAVPALARGFGLSVPIGAQLTPHAVWTYTWPLLLAVGLAAIGWRLFRGWRWYVPAGDVLVGYRLLLQGLGALRIPAVVRYLGREDSAAVSLVRQRPWGTVLWAWLSHAEHRLRLWSTVSLVLLFLIILTGVLVWFPGGG